MRVWSERVAAEKFEQFHAILCATNGRYLDRPRLVGGCVIVSYEPGDHLAMQKAWETCVTPIVEIRSDQWFKKAFRRLFLFFRGFL